MILYMFKKKHSNTATLWTNKQQQQQCIYSEREDHMLKQNSYNMEYLTVLKPLIYLQQ